MHRLDPNLLHQGPLKRDLGEVVEGLELVVHQRRVSSRVNLRAVTLSALPATLVPRLVLAALAACGESGVSAPPEGASPDRIAPEETTGGKPRVRQLERAGRGQRRDRGGMEVEVADPSGASEGTPGVVRGIVLFDGKPPVRPPILPVTSTGGCSHGEEAPLAEQVIVTDGKLENVVLSLRGLPGDWTPPPPPEEPLLIDQVRCLYVPHVSAVQVGRRVVAGNSDGIGHNVHVSATRTAGMNKTIGPGTRVAIPVPVAESYRLSCDTHPWMGAYLIAFDHPLFAVTGSDGAFRIEGVPRGTYRLDSWHERYDKLRSDEFTVGPGGEVEVTVTYKR